VDLSDTTTVHAVQVGVVIVGIYDVSEKSSSWSADYYLNESWLPAPGFVPHTAVDNEIERKSTPVDETELREGRCFRSRRLHSILRTSFNLRTFPFDQQSLVLVVTDEDFTAKQLHYEGPVRAGLDDGVLHQLAAWKVMPGLHFERMARAFPWDPGSPDYEYATFSVTVRRHVSFHLGKYFLPLLLIVIVSFAVFWIDPEDLASSVQVSVTCLLAAVALQLSEASELPDVSYLTIADRAFATSYVAIALAVLQVIYTNALVRRGSKEIAVRVDRWCRVAFPACLALALVVAVWRASRSVD
jgi:hypothetical protein